MNLSTLIYKYTHINKKGFGLFYSFLLFFYSFLLFFDSFLVYHMNRGIMVYIGIGLGCDWPVARLAIGGDHKGNTL